MTVYFDLIMIPLQLLIVFFTIYYFVISFFGIFGRKPDVKIKTPEKNFAIIVAAHNEENVIGQLVENLHLLNYPDKLYEIFVVRSRAFSEHLLRRARNATVITRLRFVNNCLPALS